MIIGNIRSKYEDGSQWLTADMTLDNESGRHFDIWFRFPEWTAPIQPVGDPFIAGLLISCMYSDEPLRIDATVSEALLDRIDTIDFCVRHWWPGQFSRVPVETAGTHGRITADTDNRGRGTFMSLGVDSWYSVLTNLDALTHLIYVKQYDSVTRYQGQQRESIAALERIARELGKKLVVVETNLKCIADKQEAEWGRRFEGNFWARHYHGSALAAVGLCLQNTIGSLLVPSTHSPPQLFPFGSHPALDVLWSSNDLEILFDKSLTRITKIARVADSPLALETLRVCQHNRPGRYNCCACEKCYRTMLALRACGALDRSPSFPDPPNLELLKRYKVTHRRYKLWFREILERAEIVGDTELADALRVLVGDRFSARRAYHLTAARVSKVGRRFVHRRVLEWWDRKMSGRIQRLEWTR